MTVPEQGRAQPGAPVTDLEAGAPDPASVIPLWFVDCLALLKLPAAKVHAARPHHGDLPTVAIHRH